MITVGGVVVSDNMYLSGVTEAKQIAYEQNRTVEGVSKLRTVLTLGGRTLTLGTSREGGSGSIQGIWCQSVIDELKALEQLNSTLVLDHHGTTYNVKIVDTSGFTQMFKYEPVSPGKAYTGKLTMIEV